MWNQLWSCYKRMMQLLLLDRQNSIQKLPLKNPGKIRFIILKSLPTRHSKERTKKGSWMMHYVWFSHFWSHFRGTMHCLPQRVKSIFFERLKSMFFEIFSNGVVPKGTKWLTEYQMAGDLTRPWSSDLNIDL